MIPQVWTDAGPAEEAGDWWGRGGWGAAALAAPAPARSGLGAQFGWPMQKELNLLSPDFDPDMALDAPQLTLPFPNVPLLDNISSCRRLLPKSAAAAITERNNLKSGSRHFGVLKPPDNSSSVSTGTEAASAMCASSGDACSADPVGVVPQIEEFSLTTQWSHSFREGPTSLLRRLQNRAVRVVVRRQHGLRAVCEGKLKLFDRHLNLVLGSASEEAVLQRSRSPEEARWPPASWDRRCVTA